MKKSFHQEEEVNREKSIELTELKETLKHIKDINIQLYDEIRRLENIIT